MAVDLGSALAIVSLAHDVCKVVIKYCSAVKHRKEDIGYLEESSSELQDILQELHTWLGNRSSQSLSTVNSTEVQVERCLKHIDKILALCEEYSSPPTKDLNSRLQYVAKGLQFPLKKETTKELEHQMALLQANIQLAITFLASKFSFEGFEHIKKLIEQSEKTTVKCIKAHIDQAEKNANKEIETVTTVVTSSIQQVEKSLSAQLQHDTIAVTHSLSPVIEAGQQLISHQLREINKQLIEIRSTVDSASYSTNSIHRSVRSKARGSLNQDHAIEEFVATCTCKSRPKASTSTTIRLGKFLSTKSVSIIHGRGCRIWYKSQRKVELEVNIRLWRLIVSGSVDFTGDYYGWKRWSIGPSPDLRFSWTVSSDSGAFALAYSLFQALNALKETHTKEDWALRKELALTQFLVDLDDAFTNGKASPYDVDERGNNILHTFLQPFQTYSRLICVLELAERVRFIHMVQKRWDIDLQAFNICDDTNEIETIVHGSFTTSRSLRQRRIQPVSMLLCDVIQMNSALDTTIEDVTTRARTLHYLLKWLVDDGIDIAEYIGLNESGFGELVGTPMARYPSFLFSLSTPEFLEACRCNALSVAVLARDFQKIETELERRPASLAEVNAFGQTAIHFASDWPDGLHILLRSEHLTQDTVNRLDNYRTSALEYAAIHGNSKSVEMLVEADCPFSLHVGNKYKPETRKILLSALYDRRQRLQELALENNAFQTNSDAEFTHSLTSDLAARIYLQSLDRISITIPESLRSAVLSTGSLYHVQLASDYLGRFVNLGYDLAIIQELIAEGFVCHDENWNGITPFMASHLSGNPIQVAEFFLQHGVDANKETPPKHVCTRDINGNRKHRVIHFLAFHLMHPTWFSRSSNTILELGQTSRLRNALFHEYSPDSCNCRCSTSGCSALTCFLKGAVFRNSKMALLDITQLCLMLDQRDVSSQNDPTIRIELIRTMTFHSLGLTHTCCSYRWSWPWPILKEREEVNLIQDEESDDIELLEKLMEEFSTELAKLEISFLVFVHDYWKKRMEHVLYNNEQMTSDELNGQHALLVWLVAERDVEDSFFTQLWKETTALGSGGFRF